MVSDFKVVCAISFTKGKTISDFGKRSLDSWKHKHNLYS